MSFPLRQSRSEILLAEEVSLRENLPEKFAETVSVLSGTRILSTLKTSSSGAYLLSESSLFVFPQRLTLITCGGGELLRGGEWLVSQLPATALRSVSYELRGPDRDVIDRTVADRVSDWSGIRGVVGFATGEGRSRLTWSIESTPPETPLLLLEGETRVAWQVLERELEDSQPVLSLIRELDPTL